MNLNALGRSHVFLVMIIIMSCFLITLNVSAQKNQEINLADLFGGEDQVCGMTCPAGQTLVKKEGYKAVPNGCGTSGEFNHISDKHGFTECCHDHDICYTDCSKTKEECDSEFSECMTGYCTKKKKKEKEECSGTANMFSVGVSVFGCDAYTRSLQEACECRNLSSKPKKHEL